MEFDPLKSTDQFDTEIVNAAKKREIRNILKSYVGTYDSFSELIQNAMDAVDKKFESKFASGEEYQKRIFMRIDLKANTFSITDNGTGFNKKEFEAFLAPNISFKDGRDTRGNKGVGATYIAYGFNFLQLGTKSSEYNFVGEISDGRKWVEDKEGIVTRPVVKESALLHEVFNEIVTGSTFTIKYGGELTRPKDLSRFSALDSEQWLYLLLLKTPLGCVDLFNTQKYPIYFDLSVIDREGKTTSISNQKASYIYPHSKINACANLKDILSTQQQLIKQGKDASKLGAQFERLNGIYEFYSSSDLKVLPTRKLEEQNQSLIEDYVIEAYGFFSYSTNLWDEFSDKLAKLRKGTRVIRGGLVLANNYMIQGDYLSIPLTENMGYQNQAHVIVHFKNADPDLGRKGFQPELREIAEIISVGIVNRIKKWKKQLRTDTGARPIITPQINLHKWIREQEKHEEEHPLSLHNSNFFKPIHEISITSVPQSEQDVIVLFNQLIAGGVIRGVKLLATSQYETYDGIFKFYVNAPEENHLYDKEKNPLGVQEIGLAMGTVSHPQVLEYKYNLDALIQEFENGEKFERDLNLAVAWTLGNEYRKNYEITSLLDLNNLHHRPFHGITHLINSTSNAQFYLIILKELLEFLNDTDGVQEYHTKTYAITTFE